MRRAFVIRLGNDCRPAEGLFEGWVEEVDSCTERRFHSTNELLAFLGQCFDMGSPSIEKAKEGESEKRPCRNKSGNSEKRPY